MESSASRSPGSARSTSDGTDRPVPDATATSRQDDVRRISNECAVDLVVTIESSPRIVTSGSAMQSARTCSTTLSASETAAPARVGKRGLHQRDDARRSVSVSWDARTGCATDPEPADGVGPMGARTAAPPPPVPFVMACLTHQVA